MKKCPFCAEEIQDEAVKCRFCGEMLSEVKAQQVSYKDVKKGIKQAEGDKITYNIKVFFSIVVGVVVGTIVGVGGAGAGWGFGVGLVVTMILGVKSANTYFEDGKK